MTAIETIMRTAPVIPVLTIADRARARAGLCQPGERGRVYMCAALPARVRARGWGARAGGEGGGRACSRSRFSCVEGVIEEVKVWDVGGGLEEG